VRHADPYAVLRNSETLQAHRAWRRAYGLVMALSVWGLAADPTHRLLRVLPLLLAGGGIAFAIGAIRVSLYQWANPPPGAPPRT
jgi:hypothetical protein